MYCKNCGAEIKNNAKFCPKCGSLVNEPPVQKSTAINANAPMPDRTQAAAQGGMVKADNRLSGKSIKSIIGIVGAVLLIAVVTVIGIVAVRVAGSDKQLVQSSVVYYDSYGATSSTYNYYYEYENGRICKYTEESFSGLNSESGSHTDREEALINYTEGEDMYFGSGVSYDQSGEKQSDIQPVYDGKNNLLSVTIIHDDEFGYSFEEYTFYDEEGRVTERGFKEDGEKIEYFTYEYGKDGEYTECYYFDGYMDEKREGELINDTIFSGQVTDYGSDGDILEIYDVTVEKVERNVYRQIDDAYEVYYYFDGTSSNKCIKTERYYDGELSSVVENVFA